MLQTMISLSGFVEFGPVYGVPKGISEFVPARLRAGGAGRRLTLYGSIRATKSGPTQIVCVCHECSVRLSNGLSKSSSARPSSS
jgi:hypothetical protein